MILTMTAPVNTDLIQWVLGWGTQAEVIKPKKLRNEMRMAGKYLVGTYK